MSAVVVATHATAASLSLTLGGYQLVRRRRGDRVHRLLGRVWVGAMYVMLVTAMFVRPVSLRRFDVFQVLAVFTFCTLTIGLLAAMRGQVEKHRGYLTGSYLGVVGAFVGAVAVPQRDIPQLVVHRPAVFAASVVVIVLVSAVVVLACRRPAPRHPEFTERARPAGTAMPPVHGQLL